SVNRLWSVITSQQPIAAVCPCINSMQCNAHRDHRSGSVRNARQGPANPENSWRIGAPLVGLRTYAPKLYEPPRASYGCAQDSNRGARGAGYHERMPVMLG